MDIIDQLESVAASTLTYFALPDEQLDLAYGPGKWSVRFVLHHLADSESILYYRIRRVISEPRQVIWVYDQDRWAEALDYATVPMELSRDIYATSRRGIIHHARRHYERAENVWFVHSDTGRRTLRDEFDKVVWHNEQHLAQIAQALLPIGVEADGAI